MFIISELERSIILLLKEVDILLKKNNQRLSFEEEKEFEFLKEKLEQTKTDLIVLKRFESEVKRIEEAIVNINIILTDNNIGYA
ncbi:MAG: hypothetical protein PHH88_01035 [Candidatus Pacebacteria bacterium]|nr:hypothetical protein [Candidatus Paceibacterota bacterium]MDD4333663.1 hypothetical protein [Candidatus Paceibacterota bacterium]